jgi:hypothetical protein
LFFQYHSLYHSYHLPQLQGLYSSQLLFHPLINIKSKFSLVSEIQSWLLNMTVILWFLHTKSCKLFLFSCTCCSLSYLLSLQIMICDLLLFSVNS